MQRSSCHRLVGARRTSASGESGSRRHRWGGLRTSRLRCDAPAHRAASYTPGRGMVRNRRGAEGRCRAPGPTVRRTHDRQRAGPHDRPPRRMWTAHSRAAGRPGCGAVSRRPVWAYTGDQGATICRLLPVTDSGAVRRRSGPGPAARSCPPASRPALPPRTAPAVRRCAPACPWPAEASRPALAAGRFRPPS